MNYKEQIQIDRIPRHVAIIMDGNGRWAKRQGMARMFGHRQGVETVHRITEVAAELGIAYLTLYAFSTENWNRPKEEVDALMSLLVDTIAKETPTLMKNNIQLLTIGDLGRLPENAQKKFRACMAETSGNTGLRLVIALSYSSRWEIIQAVRNIAHDVQQGKILVEDINEEVISASMTTSQMPDPDLLIRTSGELRISNFLLWQLAYTELYFTDCLWPEFTEEEFYRAIIDYQHRERRFGKTSEQVR
ncbi:MAG: isoprenyl transferase [Paludibacteraceae bacterium]|jgi:undecaprenyl diphosphate synthase|nr:isoprenyl transferase [Paludibacteraceae bacterium]